MHAGWYLRLHVCGCLLRMESCTGESVRGLATHWVGDEEGRFKRLREVSPLSYL